MLFLSFPFSIKMRVFFSFLNHNGIFIFQYQKCDPSDPMCAMMECGHSMTSLKERAMDKKCDEIVKLIEQVSLGKVKLRTETPFQSYCIRRLDS